MIPGDGNANRTAAAIGPVDEHYGNALLGQRVDAALRARGLNAVPLSWERLGGLDQFHIGGAATTARLAEQLSLVPESRVLDVGSGLGGPARHLAATYGCSVTGVDRHEPFVALAASLTARTGLSDRVTFARADATALPFPAECFDVAWTQHVAMNIADRTSLYTEIARVLVPGGRFAMYDVLAGDGGPLHFPVPWARDPAMSTLVDETRQRELLAQAGLEVECWNDLTAGGIRGISERSAAPARRDADSPALGLVLVMGPDFPQLVATLGRNLREGRARLVQAVARRAS